MKGYIYPMFAGADPGMGWRMTDPILGKTPTLGACMPQIRRAVTPGDMIFSISGRVKGVHQYVVGGFEVAENIDALAALARFPENKQRRLPDGELAGNIIVNSARFPLIRYAGVLGPRSAWRKDVVPKPRECRPACDRGALDPPGDDTSGRRAKPKKVPGTKRENGPMTDYPLRRRRIARGALLRSRSASASGHEGRA